MLIFVTLFSLGAAVTDLWKGKIYNKYLALAGVIGLLMRVVSEGIEILPQCIGVSLVTFLILIPVYLMRALGGGDIKMLSVAGLLIPHTDLLIVCLVAILLTVTVGILRLLVKLLLGTRSLTTVAFAVPFFCAVCFSVFSRAV